MLMRRRRCGRALIAIAIVVLPLIKILSQELQIPYDYLPSLETVVVGVSVRSDHYINSTSRTDIRQNHTSSATVTVDAISKNNTIQPQLLGLTKK